MGNDASRPNSHFKSVPIPASQCHVGDKLEYTYSRRYDPNYGGLPDKTLYTVKIICSEEGKCKGQGTIMWKNPIICDHMSTYTGPINNYIADLPGGVGDAIMETQFYEYSGEMRVVNEFRSDTYLNFVFAHPCGLGKMKYKKGHEKKTIIGVIVEINGDFNKSGPHGLSACIMDDGKSVFCVWNDGKLMSHYETAVIPVPTKNNIDR